MNFRVFRKEARRRSKPYTRSRSCERIREEAPTPAANAVGLVAIQRSNSDSDLHSSREADLVRTNSLPSNLVNADKQTITMDKEREAEIQANDSAAVSAKTAPAAAQLMRSAKSMELQRLPTTVPLAGLPLKSGLSGDLDDLLLGNALANSTRDSSNIDENSITPVLEPAPITSKPWNSYGPLKGGILNAAFWDEMVSASRAAFRSEGRDVPFAKTSPAPSADLVDPPAASTLVRSPVTKAPNCVRVVGGFDNGPGVQSCA